MRAGSALSQLRVLAGETAFEPQEIAAPLLVTLRASLVASEPKSTSAAARRISVKLRWEPGSQP